MNKVCEESGAWEGNDVCEENDVSKVNDGWGN